MTEKSSVQPVVLSVEDAAAYLSVSKPTIYRLVRSGAVPHTRVGKMLRLRVADLEAYLTDRTTTIWKKTDRTWN